MKIFIGSSKESKSSMSDVALLIEELDHEPVRWDTTGLFVAGDYAFEALEGIAKNVDAAIFIFGNEDKQWYRDKQTAKNVKDNVLIEYGFFCGCLSRKKVCICCAGNPKIASDLEGITCIDLGKIHKAKREIAAWADSVASGAVKTKQGRLAQDSLAAKPEYVERIAARYARYKEQLISAAEKGDNESRYFLGLNYFFGNIGFKQDYNEAFRQTVKAAMDNYAPAQKLLGSLYYRGKGRGNEQSFRKAFLWQKRAADRAYPSACAEVAYMYRVGLGCKQDISKAIVYYDKANALGHESNVLLGELYENYRKDFDNARECYFKSAGSSGRACHRLGMITILDADGKQSDYLEAGEWFSAAAEKGYTKSKYKLGELYYWGKGFDLDFEKARYWYEQAAEAGNTNAQYVLGYLYLYGLGCREDHDAALSWFKRAAKQGQVNSQSHAGDILLEQEMYEEAFEMYHAAADQGDAHSLRRLADLYALGLGCDKDQGKAYKYYKLAAKQGDEISQKSIRLQRLPLDRVSETDNVTERIPRRVTYEITENFYSPHNSNSLPVK